MTTLAYLIKGGLKPYPQHPATATHATPATVAPFPPPSVATVASVAVANLPVDEKSFGDDQGKRTLAELIRGGLKTSPRHPATATHATPATHKGKTGGTVADVATVAVAKPLGDKSLSPYEEPKPDMTIPPAVHQQPLPTDDLLPYPARRRLYARQNGLYLRLKRRLDKFGVFACDQETDAALAAWASDEAIEALYSGRRSWPEQRALILRWARCGLAVVRRHRDIFEERAAIMEFDGGLNRAEAELKART